MNNATHTPGPWTTEGADITNGYPEQGARVFIAEKVFSEHDAALIAAAPAMYEALKACLESLRVAMRFDDGDVFGVDHNDTVDAMGLAETALAQAEGTNR